MKLITRTRNYATVVYPESVNPDWLDILKDHKIPCFVSPIHDKDINPDNTPKKPHYHVLMMFENVKTVNQAQSIIDDIGGVGCETVNSIRSYARYLCHLDNPDKVQYDPETVISICGVDYRSIIGLASDKYKAISEMCQFCDQYDINSYYLLAKYAMLHRQDWYRVLCDNGTLFMREYLKSRMWSNDNDLKHIIDENGELIV